MTEARPGFHPQYPAQNGGDLLNSAAQEAIAPVRDGIRLEQAHQALNSLFGRLVRVGDAVLNRPDNRSSLSGIHPTAETPIALSEIPLGPDHPSLSGLVYAAGNQAWLDPKHYVMTDSASQLYREKTGLDYVTANASGLPVGMEGDFVRTPEQRAQMAKELETLQQKAAFAELSGPEKLSVRTLNLVLAAEQAPQKIRDAVTAFWDNVNGWTPRINTKFKVALSLGASAAALAACGGAVPKSPEPTPRIVQTVDVVKPTPTATTLFETPTPPAVTKEQLANVLIQQDTYTADVIESWKGDMTPTQLLARKVLKGELGPEDDAAEVRSMSYSMKNAGGFSFDIAASASDQTKMRIGFASPDGSLQMRDVRAVQEQNGAVSLLMTQEGKILVIARKSPDGTAFVINPADASGVIKKIGENSSDLSLGKDMIVIPPSPTPEPKQPNLDLLAFLFPPQKVKAELPPTPGLTTGTVFSDTVEARASATPEAEATKEVKHMQAMRLTDNVSVLPNKLITETQPLIDALRKSNPEAEKILNDLHYLSIAALMDKNPNPTQARVAEVQALIEAARKAGKPFYIEQKVQGIAGWDKDGRPLFQTASEAAAKLTRIDLAQPVIVSYEEEPDMQTRLKMGGTGSIDARHQVAVDSSGRLFIQNLITPGTLDSGAADMYSGNKQLMLALDLHRTVATSFFWASDESASTAPLVQIPSGFTQKGQAPMVKWNVANDSKFSR